jgi:hypothetical protein
MRHRNGNAGVLELKLTRFEGQQLLSFVDLLVKHPVRRRGVERLEAIEEKLDDTNALATYRPHRGPLSCLILVAPQARPVERLAA